MLAILTAATLGWTAARWPTRAPSRVRTLACNEYADEVGKTFMLDDTGRLGPWYMPTTWWRSACAEDSAHGVAYVLGRGRLPQRRGGPSGRHSTAQPLADASGESSR